MSFRRQPFQFTTIDPVKRQAELQKRFGLPSTNSDMFVDFLNPGVMGSGIKEPSSLGGSPRLQHRVPIFTEKAAKGDSEQNNVDGNHKPRVRVIPIQVEGVDGSKRHRTFSGPAGMGDKDGNIFKGNLQETFPHLNSSKVDEGLKRQSQARVCNIPIQIEPREVRTKINSNPEPESKKPSVDLSFQTAEPTKKLTVKPNGCAASSEKREEPNKAVPLKQIEAVLKKLKLYTAEVEKFSGTSKDKQYRYLDEMLTRCMLDLDNVDTLGLDEVRKARKEAVRQVQHYVDLLDTKVNEPAEKMDSDTSSIDNLVVDSKDEQMACDVPPESNDATISDMDSCESREVMNNQCVSSDVEMNGDVQTEAINHSKDINESSDVEMEEKNSSNDSNLEVTDEKVSAQDCSMDNEELVSSTAEYKNENMSPMLETEIESTPSTTVNTGIEGCNKSEVVIEELDDNLENGFNDCSSVTDENETVSCVISDSPELNVKDTIIEEGESEIVIEEVEEKDIEHSSNTCDSSVGKVDNCVNPPVEINSDVCHVTDSVSNCVTDIQLDETDSK